MYVYLSSILAEFDQLYSMYVLSIRDWLQEVAIGWGGMKWSEVAGGTYVHHVGFGKEQVLRIEVSTRSFRQTLPSNSYARMLNIGQVFYIVTKINITCFYS